MEREVEEFTWSYTKTSEYPEVALGECCTIVNGATPSRVVPEYWGGNIHWFTPKDLSGIECKYVDEAPEKITEDGYRACSTALLPKNSLLLTSRAPIGHLAINKREACTNQGFKSLIPSDRVSVEYLYYAILRIIPRLQDLGNGATFKELSMSTIKEVTIPLPPLAEQQRIASILDAADAHRQKTKALLEKYDQLAQSIFLEMFGDPVTNEKGWDIQPLPYSYLEGGCSIKCGPFGSALKRDEYIAEGVPVWVMDNIQGCRFVQRDCLYISQSKFESLQSYSVHPGDIIISRAGTVGKMCVITEGTPSGIISTNLIRLRLNPNVLKPMVFALLMHYFKDKVGRLKTGVDGAFTHMNTGVLNGLEFPLPPIQVQDEFEKRMTQIDTILETVNAGVIKSESLFQSLLQGVFKEELV